ncbi:hypothetical protein MCOR02_008158 [Pyricularia oryzae]|nr:hypothetical protein MCOR02_008158 [Pyricularia oryzae]
MRFTAAAVILAGSAAAHTTPAGSTVYSTAYETVTSCAPTVTNCPASSTVVSSSIATLTPSTVYTTSVQTITSCAPTVTNCPGKPYVVTQTIPVSTTLCPVTETKSYGNGTAGVPSTVKTATVPVSSPPAAPSSPCSPLPLVSSPRLPRLPALPSRLRPSLRLSPS